jgi:hypothetical protein
VSAIEAPEGCPMKIYRFLLLGLVTLLAANARADRPSVHGMLLFGKQVTYASHLPMFHSPHDYQVILKLELSDVPGSGVLRKYADEKAKMETARPGEERYFTLVPEVMDLTQVISGKKGSFSAVIYRGHFEREGTKLGPVKVKVEKIVFQRPLDGSQPPAAAQTYLGFGEKGEYFLAHLIQEKPSFDLIATASELPVVGDRVVEIPRLKKADQTRLPKAGEELGVAGGIQTRLLGVIYSEEGELSD